MEDGAPVGVEGLEQDVLGGGELPADIERARASWVWPAWIQSAVR